MIDRLLPASLLALLLIYLQLRSGAGASPVVLVACMAALAYVVLAAGRLLLRAIAGPESNPGTAYVLGLTSICLALYLLTATSPLSATAAFAIVAVAVVASEIAFARRRRALSPDRQALVGFALCVAFTAAWCSGPAGAYEVLRTGGVLPVWTDYFFHGSIVSQLGDARAAGHGSILLADVPVSFYHFGSYTLAAAAARFLDLPGLPVATSVWLPLGFLAMTSGAYALGERLAGPAGGIAALAAIAILPDASTYGLRNGLMSFHWSVIAHPGATYALGGAFLSLLFLERWTHGRAATALAASAALAASIFFFRVHIFLLFVPAWVATVLYCLAPENRRRLAALAIVAALGVAASAASLFLTQLAQAGLVGSWRFGDPALAKFLNELHLHQEPTAYTGLYVEPTNDAGNAGTSLAAGVLLAVMAALGAFLVLLPGVAALAGVRRTLRPIDAFPAYAAYGWLLLLLFAPLTWAADATDLIERPIVLVYACFAIWTACLLLRRCEGIGGPRTTWVWPAALALTLLALPAVMLSASGMARPKFAWGESHVSHRVEPGLVEAAAFLRKRAAAGEIFATGGLTAEFASFDLPMTLVSLTGMPAYLSRPGLEGRKGGTRQIVVGTRLAALAEIEEQQHVDDVMKRLQRMRVQWYVIAGTQAPRWDPQRRAAAFTAGTVAVYSSSATPSGAALHDQVGIRYANQVVPQDAANLLELGSRERLVGRRLAHMAAAVE